MGFKSRWHNLAGIHGCGAGCQDWIKGLKTVTNQAMKDMIPDLDPDGVDRFPPCYHVACFDNLNTLDASTPGAETARLTANKPSSRKPRTTYEGFMANGLLQAELNELMSYLGKFTSAVYVRAAPAARWNLPAEVDKITDEIVNRAAKYKVPSIRGEWLWNSIVQFATAKSSNWHHAHKLGNDRFLHHHWDRILFRTISFSKACTIHPGTLESICDKKAYDNICKEIKREEDLDRPPRPSDSSSSGLAIDAKVEDVAPDILPASASYSEFHGVSHGTEGAKRVVKRRWAGAPSEQTEQEDQTLDDPLYEEEPLDPDAEAMENEEDIQRRLDDLSEVAKTIVSNLERTAREHILLCRNDFQSRNAVPNPHAPRGTSANVPRMNETFGPDHKALEGFADYEDSLKAALVEEMTSLKKESDLVKDAPVPSILQQENRKDREIELARLASAAKGSDKGALGATAKAKSRPRSKSPNVSGFSGSKAELEQKSCSG